MLKATADCGDSSRVTICPGAMVEQFQSSADASCREEEVREHMEILRRGRDHASRSECSRVRLRERIASATLQ